MTVSLPRSALFVLVGAALVGSLWLTQGHPDPTSSETLDGRAVQADPPAASGARTSPTRGVELADVDGREVPSRPAAALAEPAAPDLSPAREGRHVVAGRVIDEDGIPVPGVQVDLYFEDRFDRRHALAGESTGEGGTYRVEFAPRAELTRRGCFVHIHGDEIVAFIEDVGLPPRSGKALEADFQVQRLDQRFVTGLVVDQSGAPVGEARVDVVSWADVEADLPVESVETAHDGRFFAEFGRLAPGTNVSAKVYREGLGSALVHGTPELGTITLQPGLVVEGRVQGRTGRPVIDLPVWLSMFDGDADSRHVTTDARGRFRFVALEPGTWKITVDGDDPTVERLVEAGATGVVVTVPFITAALKVVDASGQPLDAEDVSLFPVDPETRQRLRPRRKFTIQSKAGPDGHLDLRIQEPGLFGAGYREMRGDVAWTGYLVFKAEARHLDLTLRVEPESTRRVELVPLGPDGEPIHAWRGSVYRKSDNKRIGRVSSSSPGIALADGAHVVDLLHLGETFTPGWRATFNVDESSDRIELRAPGNGGRAEFHTRLTAAARAKVPAREARSGEVHVDVRIRPTGTVRWAYLDVGLAGFGTSSAAVALAPGEYEWSARRAGANAPFFKSTQGVMTVRDGETTEVEVLVDL